MKPVKTTLGSGVLLAVGIILMVLPAATFSRQTETPPTPSGPVPPGNRVCCSLGFAIGIEPSKLAGHDYGNQNSVTDSFPDMGRNVGEPVGYVYTAAAGLVDIGHVRDNADLTLSIYEALLNGDHSIGAAGNTVGVASIPSAKDQMLALACSIAYVSSWAHELVTWGDTTALTSLSLSASPEDYSAFSPEDLSSNIVGIEIAMRAIQAGSAPPVQSFNRPGGQYDQQAIDTLQQQLKAFNKQVDVEMAKMMLELKAQPAAATTALLVQVKFIPGGNSLAGKWWMDDPEAVANGTIRLLRRNFDGAAWKIAGAPQAPTPTWLNTTLFSGQYAQFLYVMNTKKYVDATQVPRTSMYALQPPGSRILLWTAITPGKIPTAGQYVDVLGGGFRIVGAAGKPLSSGLFANVKVNTYTDISLNILANMADATNVIRAAFVQANPGMDGP
jgi:uncharacterized protein DUF4056